MLTETQALTAGVGDRGGVRRQYIAYSFIHPRSRRLLLTEVGISKLTGYERPQAGKIVRIIRRIEGWTDGSQKGCSASERPVISDKLYKVVKRHVIVDMLRKYVTFALPLSGV
jgi:hypothetical protein